MSKFECASPFQRSRHWNVELRDPARLLTPLDRHAALLLEAVVEKELLVPDAVLVHELRAFHVEAAVFGDFEQLALAPPADRIEAVAGLADAERGRGERVEAEAMAELA